MAWVYPIMAGLFEIGWPVGLKRSQTPGRLLRRGLHGRQRRAALAGATDDPHRHRPRGLDRDRRGGDPFEVGILFYGDPAGAWRPVSVGPIIAGIVGLKRAHGSG